MKVLIRLSFLLVLATALFTSCKKASPKQTKHIPKNALMVATVNTSSLEDKMVKSQATLDNIFKAIADNDSSIAKGKEKWEELKNAGVDFDENFYLSMVQKGGSLTGGKGTMVISGLGTLKDASKLEAYIKKEKPTAEIKKEKDYSYVSTEGSKMVAWGNDMVIMMVYEKSYSSEMEYDSVTGEYNFKTPVNDDADLKAEMNSYFSMKEDESVSSIPEFRDLMQDKADASLWINSSSSLENMPLPLPKLKELVENSYTAATINFEDGKIVMDSKSYNSPALRDMIKKYSGPTVDLSLVETYPSSNINGFMSIAVNPEFFSAFIKYLEVGGVIDGFLTNSMGMNYSYNDIIKIIKGDLAIIVSDFQMPAPGEGGMLMNDKLPVKYLVNLPINDAAQLNKLMDKLAENQMVVKANNEYHLNPALQKQGFVFTADAKNIFIASDSLLLAQYKAKSGKANLSSDVTKDFDGKNAAFYINIESILNGIPMDTSNEEMKVIMPKAKETFKDVTAYSKLFNGKYTEGHAEIRMKNEKQNSLTSILEFIGAAAETAQKAKEKKEAMWKDMGEDVLMDSVVAVPE